MLNQRDHLTHKHVFKWNLMCTIILPRYETIQNSTSLDIVIMEIGGIKFSKFPPDYFQTIFTWYCVKKNVALKFQFFTKNQWEYVNSKKKTPQE